jgi:hypothetical protein
VAQERGSGHSGAHGCGTTETSEVESGANELERSSL